MEIKTTYTYEQVIEALDESAKIFGSERILTREDYENRIKRNLNGYRTVRVDDVMKELLLLRTALDYDEPRQMILDRVINELSQSSQKGD